MNNPFRRRANRDVLIIDEASIAGAINQLAREVRAQGERLEDALILLGLATVTSAPRDARKEAKALFAAALEERESAK